MYKANIYLKILPEKACLSCPLPPEGGLTHGLPISNFVLMCALAPLQGKQGLSESIVKSD